LDVVTANLDGSVSVLLGNGDRTFQPAVHYATGGTGARSVALGRLRPGGPLDVITTNPDSGTVSVLLGRGDGTFRAGGQYSVDPDVRPFAVAVGDFTGRGIPDLVTVNVQQDYYAGFDSFSVLAGNGDGTFQTAVTYTLPRTPSSLAAGDFTGNGRLGLAVGTGGGVMVLLGNGDRTFQAPVFYPTDPHSGVPSVLVRDLAGTGRLDLVTANPGADTVSVLRGHGDGTFAPAANYPVGGRLPLTVDAGRFRPGGPLDLVTANQGDGSVSVLPGAGDGTFGPPSQYAAGSRPNAVAAADFAGRGTDDIAATNDRGVGTVSTVRVLFNQGDGTFPPPPLPQVQVGQGTNSLATGDFRGIGVQDLVTTNFYSGTVSVFLGNGDGTFGAPHTFPAGPTPVRVVVGDFNGDGRLDLAVADSPFTGTPGVSILLGNGDGTFQAPRSFPAGGLPLSIAAGHFHDPNILDLVVTVFVVTGSQQNRANVLLGNGDGTFQAPVSYPVGRTPLSVAVGDLRGNGITDLVVANADGNTVSVLRGNGDGTFGSAVDYRISNDFSVAFYPRFVTVGDLRGNGRLDIVTLNGGGRFTATVLPSNGDGTFGAPIPIDAGPGARAAAIADFDGDGTPDLLVTNQETDTVSLLPGNGDGTFRPRVRFAVGAGPLALAVGDFSGHNLPDVAVLNANTISVVLNDGRPSPPAAAPSGGGQGRPSSAPAAPTPMPLPHPAPAAGRWLAELPPPRQEVVDRVFAAGVGEGRRLARALGRSRALRLADAGEDPLAATAPWLP
jgi:hypothetical protein